MPDLTDFLDFMERYGDAPLMMDGYIVESAKDESLRASLVLRTPHECVCAAFLTENGHVVTGWTYIDGYTPTLLSALDYMLRGLNGEQGMHAKMIDIVRVPTGEKHV